MFLIGVRIWDMDEYVKTSNRYKRVEICTGLDPYAHDLVCFYCGHFGGRKCPRSLGEFIFSYVWDLVF